VYYAEDSEDSKLICSVTNKLDRDDASSVAVLQEIFNDSDLLKLLKEVLADIHANFRFLSYSITKSEKTTQMSYK
jgi:hypothetical protein